MLARIWSSFTMGFWIFVMAWLAWWGLTHGWWMMGHDWVWTGLALCLVCLLVMGVCGYGVTIVLTLLAGRTTPRLARRDFRNSLANLAMFAKTGLWKW